MDRIPKQKELYDDLVARLNVPLKDRKMFYLYYGGNGSGKTHAWAYVTALMALGHTTTKYKLPFLWTKKVIWICTKSGSNVRSVIMPYLIWEFSKTRIPPEEIEKLEMEKGLLKMILLKNWCVIHIKTYDQGQENVQWWSPDWIWLDEEPVNADVWSELKARARKDWVEMLITMTPLNGLNGVYEFFFNSGSPELEAKCKIYRVSSMDNPFTNKTWTLGMTDEEYRLRVDGTFENPTWLVYSSFSRSRNVLPQPDITQNAATSKFYRAIDFWTSHPTGVIFMMQDEDDNLIIYDEIKIANAELKDIAKQVKERSGTTQFEYFVRDSASKREGLEFERQFGIYTVPADKRSKGANDMSNRRTGILMINSLLKNWKLFITDNCKELIKEFESHRYKDWNATKDGEVVKINDDLLDATRYAIFLVKKNETTNSVSPLMKEFNKKFPDRNKKHWFKHL
jgi:phage terminase large subunit-like protein